MYAVIFRAEIAVLDTQYADMASRMRDLAIGQHGCIEFVSCTEGSQEIAISYWRTQEQIRDWKHNAEHLVAQEYGRSKWYRSYTVEVVEVVRSYVSAASGPLPSPP
jgi:heme-degrading monooxygenase HmoA